MYLTNIPDEANTYGISKVLMVRYETIHIKHILTEIFVKKSIDINKILDKLELSLFDYMEYMSNRLRKIYKFSREYSRNPNDVVKNTRDSFFPTIELYQGLKNTIVLDFDGVITAKNFRELYELCCQRCKVIVCTANPTVDTEWFTKHNLTLPNRIESCKGKSAKMKRLMLLMKQHDNVFYVDNETEYLDFAWILGIKTFHYTNSKITYYSLNK